MRRTLPLIITILALADAVLHLTLDFVLFRGNLLGPLNLPPGVTPPFPIPLNTLFVLNFLGFLVLVLAFWLLPRRLGRRWWLVDVAMIAYAAATIVGWVYFGKPNPMGLGYLSKAIEILLIGALVAHMWTGLRRGGDKV